MRLPVSAAPPAIHVVYCEVDGLPVTLDERGFGPAGAFVVTTTPPAPDSELELYLQCDGAEATVKGHVVQSIDPERATREGRVPGFGVLFADLDDTQRRFIAHALERLSARAVELEPQRIRMVSSPAPESDAPERAAHEVIEVTPGTLDLPHREVSRVARARSTPEARSLVKRMRSELEELSRLPAWQVLDVEPNCSASQAKAAFFMASKQFHPHLFARHNSTELDRLVTELFIAHKRAYTTLARSAEANAPAPPEPRRQAPADVASPAKRGRAASERPAADAPAVAATANDPKPATRSSIRAPARQAANGPEAIRAQAEMRVSDALKHLAASRFDRALELLQEARELDPDYEQGKLWLYLCEARKAKAEDRTLVAVDRYNRVLELDPQHHEALAAIRASDAGDGKKGRKLFGKLFGANRD